MRRTLILLLVVVGLITVQVQAALTNQLTGLVIHVGDGDSLTLLDEHQQRHRIRLAEIDAPELGQAYGQASKRALKNLINQQQVRIDLLETDQYGRIIGIVYFNDQDVSAYMLAQGMAWVYPRYLRRPKLQRIEQKARKYRRGLWQQPEHQRIAPWTWRQQKRQQPPNLKESI